MTKRKLPPRPIRGRSLCTCGLLRRSSDQKWACCPGCSLRSPGAPSLTLEEARDNPFPCSHSGCLTFHNDPCGSCPTHRRRWAWRSLRPAAETMQLLLVTALMGALEVGCSLAREIAENGPRGVPGRAPPSHPHCPHALTWTMGAGGQLGAPHALGTFMERGRYSPAERLGLGCRGDLGLFSHHGHGHLPHQDSVFRAEGGSHRAKGGDVALRGVGRPGPQPVFQRHVTPLKCGGQRTFGTSCQCAKV